MLSIPLILEMDFLLDIWLKETPQYTSIFIKLLIANSLVYYFVSPSRMALEATGKIGILQLTTGMIDLMNLAVTYILWKNLSLEPYSIFIINICLSFFIFITTIIIQKRQLGFHPLSYLKHIVRPALTVSLLGVIIPLLIKNNMDDGALRFLLVTLSSTVACTLLIYFWGIDANLRAAVRQYISSYLSKFQKRI